MECQPGLVHVAHLGSTATNQPTDPSQDMRLAEAEDLKVSEMALTGLSDQRWKTTPPKINMEHNHGGLEDDFPF